MTLSGAFAGVSLDPTQIAGGRHRHRLLSPLPGAGGRKPMSAVERSGLLDVTRRRAAGAAGNDA